MEFIKLFNDSFSVYKTAWRWVLSKYVDDLQKDRDREGGYRNQYENVTF
jgi:hypothetical protein